MYQKRFAAELICLDFCRGPAVYTVCPRSLDQFYVVTLLYKMGQDFLDISVHAYKSTTNNE